MALIICAECGNQMSDKASACPHCGASYSAAPAAVEIKCEECGSVLPDGADICPNCGCPVNIEQQMPAQPFPAAQPTQPIFASPPAVSAPAYGEEQFESVIIKGKTSPVCRIVCTVIACLLWLAAAAAVGLVICDFRFAETIGGVYYFVETPDYYSTLAGGKFIEQHWLVVGLAGAAAAAVIGAVVFIAGFGKRIKVTNARVAIKSPFKPTPRLTWDRIEMAAKETDASFVVKSGEKRYHVRNLKNQEEVFGVVSDMLSRKSSGTLKMPAVYGVKSVFGKFLRKKAAVIAAAVAVVVVIAAAALTPVIMKLSARQVTDVAYEWTVKEIYYGGGLDTAPKVIERTITGCYSGGWLNGKPYGTGTFLSDSGNYSPFNKDNTYTGTWKNGEPCKGKVVWTSVDGERSIEVFDGSFNHSRAHGQCKVTDRNHGTVSEGEFKYGAFYNGTITNSAGEVVATYRNGKQAD